MSVFSTKAYFGEFRTQWRVLIAVAMGLGGGAALQAYTASIFAPRLLGEFGWPAAQFALSGLVAVITMIFVPIAGRLADKFGVRRTAAIGVVGVPLTFLAYSFMRGDVREYFAIMIVQMLLGATTTSVVYSRLVAERYRSARGLALSIVLCGPALVGAFGAPILNAIIDAEGWRVGYRCLAIFAAVFGASALLVMENDSPKRVEQPGLPRDSLASRPDGRLSGPRAGRAPALTLHWSFWVILSGMILCNLAASLPASQLSLVLIESGATPATASAIFSMYALGVIAGRFACGLALDRLPAYAVASVGMGLPAVGLFVLASSLNGSAALAFAVLLLGVSQGAEGDLAAYLVVRYLGLASYSSLLGFVVAGIGGASALGAGILSWSLARTDSFSFFLSVSGAATLVGSALFLLLGRCHTREVPAAGDVPAGADVRASGFLQRGVS